MNTFSAFVQLRCSACAVYLHLLLRLCLRLCLRSCRCEDAQPAFYVMPTLVFLLMGICVFTLCLRCMAVWEFAASLYVALGLRARQDG